MYRYRSMGNRFAPEVEASYGEIDPFTPLAQIGEALINRITQAPWEREKDPIERRRKMLEYYMREQDRRSPRPSPRPSGGLLPNLRVG